MDAIRRRADFLAAGRGALTVRAGCVLQAVMREGAASPGAPRFGFTVTQKIGNAVVRNRVRRRLRAAAKSAALHGRPGADYVLVARSAALTLPLDRLVTDLIAGLAALAPAARTKTGPSDGQ